MATPTPPTSGPNIGTSRLLGTNGLQQAVDSLTRQINRLSSGLGRMGGASNNNSGGSYGFGMQWNTNSNRSGYSSNGGGGRFTTGTMGTNGPNGGGGNFGNLMGMSRMSAGAGAVAGIASSLVSYANRNMSTNMQMDYFGTQSAIAGGGGYRTGSQVARAAVFNNNYAALNATDAAKAGYLNQYTFGNAQFNGQANPAFVSGQRQANAFAYANPTFGAYGGALAAQQTYSARSLMALTSMGYGSPIGFGGVKNSMGNIAQSIYRGTFGGQNINLKQFNASVQQGGSLAVNLQALGAQAGWSQSTIQEYQNVLQGQVAAQNKGMSANKYYQLLGQASGGNKSAINQLAKTTGMGTSMFENQRNLNSTRLTRQNDILDSLAPAFDSATQAVNKFSQALTSFLQATGLDKAIGYGAGTLSPFSNALGGLSGGLGTGLGLFGAARLMGGGGGILGSAGGAGGLGGAGGAAAGGLAAATRLTGVLGLVLGGGYGLSKLGKTDPAGNPTKGESFTDWLSSTFSWKGVKNTFNVKENTRNIWGPIANLFGSGSSDGRAGGANDAKGGGGGAAGAAATSGAGGANAAQVIRYAEKQLGDPYQWGGTGPNSWDCSGLIQWAYKQAGVKIPRTSQQQQKIGKAVATDKVQPGDLLFNGNPAHHVVMAIGGGKIIEAPRTGLNVRIRSFSPGEFTNARRILGSVGDMSDLLNEGKGDTATLNDQQSTVGGNIGGGYGGTSELAAIMGALGGGLGAGGSSLSSQSTSSTTTADSSSSVVSGSNPPGNPKGNIALGKKLAAAQGWTGNQWKALYNLWQRESGWNEKAKNSSSGAYGIPQSLPANKMASSGSDWQTNAETQIKWGLAYIKERYGSPAKAWSFWNSKNPHWYDKGAWEIGQDVTARVHKGEMIIPAQQAETIRQTLLNNTFNPNLQKAAGIGSNGTGISFGDIHVNLPATYTGTAQEAQDMGKTIVNAMEEHLRLKNLQMGQ